MATRFEFLLCGGDEGYLRSVAEEAMDEVERIEEQISLFIPTSDISRINRRAADEAVKVDVELFELLLLAQRINRETDGAFDITVAPILDGWGRRSGEQRKQQTVIGMDNVLLDEAARTVRFKRRGVAIDLGGIGKGYAIEMAAEIVAEHGVESALLHAGTSTVQALGSPPDGKAWKVGIVNPLSSSGQRERAAVVCLKDEALSVSSPFGRRFKVGAGDFGHIVNPRSGMSADGVICAVAVSASATRVDALSTAFCVMGEERTAEYCSAHREVGALLLLPGQRRVRLAKFGEIHVEEPCGE